MSKRDGGPAFAYTVSVREFPDAVHMDSGKFIPAHTGIKAEGGMTLRDYFAAAALPQCLSAVDNPFKAGDAAARAYVVADAMLAERAKDATP